MGQADPAAGGPRVVVDRELDLEGVARAFTLTLGQETVRLEPNKTWIHTDHHKWVTRGLIEAPQSFHVHRDGSVDINGETVRLTDEDGPERLARELNKHHEAVAPRRTMPATAAARSGGPPPAGSQPGCVQFRVRLDHLGHLLIEARSGNERQETGLKGLQTLVQNGLLLPPREVHLDPLQRHLDLDGVRFACDAAGALQLEEALNSRYAPQARSAHDAAIEIRENPASPTGFDIQFVTIRAGARFDVKGHLTQHELDILQDPNKSELLARDIVLKLSPPLLLIRRRRPDGGEERIPGIEDIQYLRATARQLEEMFNHPQVRGTQEGVTRSELEPGDLVRLRVVRRAGDPAHLWLEGDTVPHAHFESRVLTHHNMAELQQRGCFQPHLRVTCTVDNSTLEVLDTRSGTEEKVRWGATIEDAELHAAGLMLTAALRPSRLRPEPSATEIGRGPAASGPTAGPAVAAAPPARAAVSRPAAPPVTPRPAAAAAPTAKVPPPPAAEPPAPALNPSILALFSRNDPWRTNEEVFRSLVARFGLPVQDLLLSLPRVFEDRRFEVLAFEGAEITSVLDLRGPEFYGFYLTHIGTERIDLVYACRGVHLEWGTDKCVVQSSLHAEPVELRESGLRGLALTADNRFAFIVSDAYRAWIRPLEPAVSPAASRFLTVSDLAAEPEAYTLVWPPRRDLPSDG